MAFYIAHRPPEAVAQAATPPRGLVVEAAQRPDLRRGGRVVQNRWSGYQWVGLPPIPPLPKQVVLDDAVWTAAAQQNRARRTHIIQQRAAAEETFATPTKPIVIGQAEQAAVRRAHHGSVAQSRWPGYEWVGLAPVTPTPRQTVQDQAAVWQARQSHRRGLVVEPGVQAAAAASGAAPVTPPLPKQVVQDQAAFQPRRVQHGGRIVEPGVQLAAASAPAVPVTTPLPRQIVILARATPRQARSGHVIQPRTLQAPVAPPRTVNVIDLCPATSRRQRGGHVVVGRPVTQPVTPRRSQQIRPVSQRRPRRGAVIAQHGRFVQTGGATTLITTPLTGYVSGGDRGSVASGDTAQPPAGDTGTVKTGTTGFPRI